MKKTLFLLGVIASAFILASCCAKDNSMSQTVAPTAAPVAHHDYKGEVGK